MNFEEEFSKITEWIYGGDFDNFDYVSAYLLDRIFTRAYFSFSYIEKIKFHNAGEKLNYQIIAFLNAILVEESIDRGISDINLNSRSNTIEVFFNNLRVTARKSRLTFFKAMLSCPLLIDFMDPYYKNLISKFGKYDEKINIDDAIKYRILKNSTEFRNSEIKSIETNVEKLKNQEESYQHILEQIRKYQLTKRDIVIKNINNGHNFEPLENIKTDIINNILQVEHDEVISFDKLMNNIRNVDNENSFTTYQDLYFTCLIKRFSLEKTKEDEKKILHDENEKLGKIENSAFIDKIYETKENSVYNTLCNIKLE